MTASITSKGMQFRLPAAVMLLAAFAFTLLGVGGIGGPLAATAHVVASMPDCHGKSLEASKQALDAGVDIDVEAVHAPASHPAGKQHGKPPCCTVGSLAVLPMMDAFAHLQRLLTATLAARPSLMTEGVSPDGPRKPPRTIYQA